MNQVSEIPEAASGGCVDATGSRHLLVLCHDIIDAQFDRRIAQQAAVWASRGWDVTIVGMTQTDGDQVERWPNGVMCIKVDQRRLLPVDDPFWADLLTQSPGELGQRADRDANEQPGESSNVGVIEDAGISELLQQSTEQLSENPPLAAISPPHNLVLSAIRPFWKWLPLSWRRFGWHCRAKLNVRTRVARFVSRCHLLWVRWRQHVQAWAVALSSTMPLPRFGWGLRTRLAKVAVRWQIAVPASLTPLLEWYPLPFTASLLQTSARLRPDVILACDLTTIPAALRLSENTGALLIYDSHEFYPEQVSFTPRQRALLRAWDIRGFNSAFLAYTVSPAIARLMHESYGLEQMPQSLSNAPDFQIRASVDVLNGPLRRALGIGSTIRVILYHGGFSRVRNLDILISGFVKSALPNTCLVLLGYGDKTWIDDLIRSADGEEVVHVLDAVAASVLDRWVADANFVAIPYSAVDLNTEFCSPNKFHDCIALGVPVLANQQLRDVADMLNEFRIGLSLDMTSTDALASSLLALSGFQASAAGFDAARDAFGWAAQQRKVGGWIAMIEAELSKRAVVAATVLGPEAAIGAANQ